MYFVKGKKRINVTKLDAYVIWEKIGRKEQVDYRLLPQLEQTDVCLYPARRAPGDLPRKIGKRKARGSMSCHG